MPWFDPEPCGTYESEEDGRVYDRFLVLSPAEWRFFEAAYVTKLEAEHGWNAAIYWQQRIPT